MKNLLCCCLTILTMTLTVAGCSSSAPDMPKLGKVRGTVTLDGNPLANASVAFASANGQVAMGTTDSAGRYELTFKDADKGAELGPNKVSITTILDAPPAPNYKDPIPEKYNTNSQLSVDVQPGDNTHDFSLESR